MHELHQQVFEAELIVKRRRLLRKRGHLTCQRLQFPGNPKLHQKWAFVETTTNIFLLGSRMELVFTSESDAFDWLATHAIYRNKAGLQVIEMEDLEIIANEVKV